MSKMASANVNRAIQSALDFLATRERSVVLKREQKQAIVSLLNGEDVLAVLQFLLEILLGRSIY